MSKFEEYVAMAVDLEEKPDEWHETREGMDYLDKMDSLWDELTDDEVRVVGEEIEKRLQ